MRCLRTFSFLLVTVSVGATPVFRIDFEGVVTAGQVASATTAGLTPTPIDLSGVLLRGTIQFDANLAPTANESGSSRSFSDVDGTDWMNGRVQIDLPVLPIDLLPVPNILLFAPVSRAPFVPLSPTAASRDLLVTDGDPCCDFLSATIGHATAGQEMASTKVFSVSNQLQLLLFPGDSFLPTGAPWPVPFVTGPSLTTSTLQFLGSEQDPSILAGPLFGVSQSFVYNLDFSVRRANGYFVPEPGTALLCGAAFILFIQWRKSK